MENEQGTTLSGLFLSFSIGVYAEMKLLANTHKSWLRTRRRRQESSLDLKSSHLSTTDLKKQENRNVSF